MKIIKKGREQKGWASEFECTGSGNGDGGCGAILLVEEEDVYLTSSSALHEIDYYNTFKCCACGVLTDIPDRDFPGQLRTKLHEKRRRENRYP